MTACSNYDQLECILCGYIHSGYSKDMPSHAENPAAFLPLPPATLHILLALAEEDRHGYAIIQDIAARTGGAVTLGPGTLYRSIQRMLEQGLVVETQDRPAPELDDERRRYYRLTDLGRAVAHADVDRLADTLALARARGFVPAGGRA